MISLELVPEAAVRAFLVDGLGGLRVKEEGLFSEKVRVKVTHTDSSFRPWETLEDFIGPVRGGVDHFVLVITLFIQAGPSTHSRILVFVGALMLQ